jgi:hypothetical protein
MNRLSISIEFIADFFPFSMVDLSRTIKAYGLTTGDAGLRGSSEFLV